MIKTVSAINLGNTPINVNVEIELPSKCPCCNVAYANEPLISYFISSENFSETEENLYALYFCPHCEQCFFTHYNIFVSDFDDLSGEIVKTFPYDKACTEFPSKIAKLSPQFIKIYSQAEKAEQTGLLEICGLGYRKALEFLLKDFAIHIHPELVESIKTMPLGQCIRKYISVEKIKVLAERSTWIGNDEAHYVKKQNDYNVSDMKSFIEACVYFISMTLITEEAASMTPKN